jgi:signal transduction histidine kinase
VPELVAEALLHATREALANVAAHAGTGEAWVTAGPVTDGLVTDGAAGPGPAVQVRIRDSGRGFDPGLISPSRLGVRMSISERIADCGGSAAVRSAPGEGTEVCLCWPAPAVVAPVPGPLAAAGSAVHAEVPPC